MTCLVDTDRTAPSALDRAVASILKTALRGAARKCQECKRWVEDTTSDYVCQATLVQPEADVPRTVKLELKTRNACFRCPEGCEQQSTYTGNREPGPEHCRVHVKTVYTLHGSDFNSVKKGFVVVCPDCGDTSPTLDNQQAVKHYIQQHLLHGAAAPAAAAASSSSTNGTPVCTQLTACYEQGGYNTPAACGEPAVAEPAAAAPTVVDRNIQQLLARIVTCCALHITVNTRPHPGPEAAAVMQYAAEAAGGEDIGLAVRTALEVAALGATSPALVSQLFTWRTWAVKCLTRNEQLLSHANWARPKLYSTTPASEVSLLDQILSPPFISAAQNQAGMVTQKLAAVLKRLRQKRVRLQISTGNRQQALQEVEAAAGAPPTPAAAAAAAGQSSAAPDDARIFTAEQLLSELLASDPVFQHCAEQQRVSEFLQQAAVSMNDLLAAMSSKIVNSAHVMVCAVCGEDYRHLAAGVQLQRCDCCVVCVCGTCLGASTGTASSQAAADQQEAALGAAVTAASGAAAATGTVEGSKERMTCPWCLDQNGTAAAGGKGHSNKRRSNTARKRITCHTDPAVVAGGFSTTSHHAAAAAAAAQAVAAPAGRCGDGGGDGGNAGSSRAGGRDGQSTQNVVQGPTVPAAAAAGSSLCWGASLPDLDSSYSKSPWYTTNEQPLSGPELDAIAAQFACVTQQQLTEQQRAELGKVRTKCRWRCVIPARHNIPPGWLEYEVERSDADTGRPHYIPPNGTPVDGRRSRIRSRREIESYLATQQTSAAAAAAEQEKPATAAPAAAAGAVAPPEVPGVAAQAGEGAEAADAGQDMTPIPCLDVAQLAGSRDSVPHMTPVQQQQQQPAAQQQWQQHREHCAAPAGPAAAAPDVINLLSDSDDEESAGDQQHHQQPHQQRRQQRTQAAAQQQARPAKRQCTAAGVGARHAQQQGSGEQPASGRLRSCFAQQQAAVTKGTQLPGGKVRSHPDMQPQPDNADSALGNQLVHQPAAAAAAAAGGPQAGAKQHSASAEVSGLPAQQGKGSQAPARLSPHTPAQQHRAAPNKKQQQQQLAELDQLNCNISQGLSDLMLHAGDNSDAQLVLAAMQRKKLQLVKASQEAADVKIAAHLLGPVEGFCRPQLVQLQVLQQIVSCVSQLQNDSSKQLLLQCLGGFATSSAAAAGASSSNRSVLDQLMECWVAETGLTGCGVQQAAELAAGTIAKITNKQLTSSTGSTAEEKEKTTGELYSFAAGMCCMVLDVLAKSCETAAAAAAEPGICRRRAAAECSNDVLQQSAQQLSYGTALLLLHWPAVASRLHVSQGLLWRQSLWFSLQPRQQQYSGPAAAAAEATGSVPAVLTGIADQLQELQGHYDNSKGS